MSELNCLLPFGSAICYSGYRAGQSPREDIFPSYQQVKQDLLILMQHWTYLRLYDISRHAEIVLEVIREEKLPLKVMLGNDLRAEVSNPACPWGAEYSDQQLADNKAYNESGLKKLIELANQYPDIVFAASIGNEASVEWTDHLVPTESLLRYAKALKAGISQPITFCENYVPWTEKLEELVELLDFLSIHTYPVWEYKTIDQALDYTKQNYASVAERYPHKPVIITEAGWTTNTNGLGMPVESANTELQTTYVQQLVEWSESEQIMTFLFEAFDEPWKGSEDRLEPEKHWGLYYEDRSPKPVIADVFER